MKNLKLNQMEEIAGSGYCTIARRYEFLYRASLSMNPTLGLAAFTYSELCKKYGDVYTFSPK